jgi:hypothetical protein
MLLSPAGISLYIYIFVSLNLRWLDRLTLCARARLASVRRGAMNQPHHVVSNVVRLALPPNTLCSGSASFGSAWGDESTPPRGVERGQVGSAA